MSKKVLKVYIENLHFRGNKLVGDLHYIPYYITVMDYEFEKGDTVEIDDEDQTFILMEEDKLFMLN